MMIVVRWLFFIYCFNQATGEAVSVFILDAKVGSSDTQLELAKAHVKRLKTLRHPNVLTFIDSLEVIRLSVLKNFASVL